MREDEREVQCVPRMREMTPRECFNFHVEHIREGYLENVPNHETNAKELAQKYGFPLQAVEDALHVGVQAAFDRYVNHINSGDLSYEAQARQLMGKYRLPPRSLGALEDALLAGRQALFDIYISHIRNGEFGYVFASTAAHIKQGELKYESDARLLAIEHSIPLQSLEEALPVGRQLAIDKCLREIRGGNLMHYEEYARRLIEKQGGVSLQALEEALPAGRQALFGIYLRMLTNNRLDDEGRLDLEQRVRQFATDHGFPLQAVEDALTAGRQEVEKREKDRAGGK